MTPADFGTPTLAFRKRCAWEYFHMQGHADLHYATLIGSKRGKDLAAAVIGESLCKLRDLDLKEGVGDE